MTPVITSTRVLGTARPASSPRTGAQRPCPGSRTAALDAGSASLFLVISMLGLLVLVGLVVDGGVKVRAIGRADALAGEAARSAGQAINAPAAITGRATTVDRRAAVAAAQTFLRTNHVAGTVTVINGGEAIRVQVRISTDTVFLGLVGIHRMHVSGQATAELVTTDDTRALDTPTPQAPTGDAWALADRTTGPVGAAVVSLVGRRSLR